MIKRFNKATSLLIAAASVASVIPTGVMAADYTRVETQEGTIYNAVAYDGKFVIDGNIVDEDTDAVYYLSDGKYTELDDVDSGDVIDYYGDKYLDIEDGDYYLDLEDGKVTDDEIKEDAQDDAASELRKNIRKDNDGRYAEGEENQVKDLDGKEIAGYKFAKKWYELDLTADSDDNNDADSFHVYVDAEGNYIDADYNIGKINVSTTTDGSIDLSNTSDDDEGYTVSVSHVKTIASDENYIYRFAKISIFNKDGDNVTNEEGVTFGSNNDPKTVTNDGSIVVLQKISKAQDSEDIDGAKFAKSVDTYFVTNEDAEAVQFDGAALEDAANFTVVNGKLIAYRVDGVNLKATSYDLKSKSGFYYVDEDDSADIDLETSSAYAVDVDGNLWGLNSGYVKKFNNSDDFEKVYKVDGSMEELSVYDKENIVVWNEDDEVYSIITPKTEEEPTDDVVTQTGWVQNANGTWNYLKADGSKTIGWVQSPASGLWYYMDANGAMMTGGWIKENGVWYYLNASGAMKTGWVKDNGTWYYLQSSGAMKTGWLNDRGTWYYLNASGAMLSNTTVNGYVLGASGAWIR
jgi:hypothetical protein